MKIMLPATILVVDDNRGILSAAELLLRTDGTIELIRRAQTLDDYFATLRYEGGLLS